MDAFSSGDPLPPGPLPYADITNPQSLNKYTYTYNNPLRYRDPDGHNPAVAVAACAVNPICAGTAITIGVAAYYLYATPQGEQLRHDTAQLIQRGVEKLSSLTFSRDAEAGELQKGADKAAEAARDAIGKLGQAEAGRELTQTQQAEGSRRTEQLQKGLDKDGWPSL